MHVAFHGEFDRAKPLKSRIRLAPLEGWDADNGGPDLSAGEVLGL